MHFCKANQNVRKRQNAVFFALQKTKAVRCKNAFDAKMLCFLLCEKQRCVHFVLLNILLRKMYALPKCILASNAFDAKMHLMPKCILSYIFQRKMFSITFDFVKCSASHFPLENVQQRYTLRQFSQGTSF